MLNQTVKSNLKKSAERAVSHLPQYAGCFDNYILIRIKKTIKTKLGVAFIVNEFAIAEPVVRTCPGNKGPVQMMPIWSTANECITLVNIKNVEKIENIDN